MSPSLHLLKRLVLATAIGLTIGCLGNRLRSPRAAPSVALPSPAPTLSSNQKGPSRPLILAKNIATQSWEQLLEAVTKGTPSQLAHFLGLLDKHPNAEMRRALRRIAFQRWIKIDAESAWRFARTQGERTGDRAWAFDALRAWADWDPHTAAATIAADDFPMTWKSEAGEAVIHQIGDRDPRLALTILRKFGFDTHLSYRDVFARLAVQAPEEAVRLAHALPPIPESSRSFALDAAISGWALHDAKAAFAWTQANAPDRHHVLDSTARSWGNEDPQGFLASDELLTLKRYPEVIGQVLGTWWARDPVAAQAWYDEQTLVTDPDQQKRMGGQLILQLARTAPEQAAPLLAELVLDPKDRNPTVQLGTQWAREDPDTALAWAKALPRGDARDNALLVSCAYVAKRDPLRMLEELPDLAPSLKSEFAQQRQLAQTMIDTLSHQGLSETHAWLDQLPPAYRRTFWESYTKVWAAREPEAIIDYLLSQITVGQQISGVQSALNAWARLDPAAAASRALTFPDQEMRELSARNVMNVWKIHDPTAASAWAESVEDDAVRNALEKSSRY